MSFEPKSPARLHRDAPPEPDDLGPLSDDAITANFRILQRVHGHRYSLDDVITAWDGACAKPQARHALELGSGIGSVLLMLAYKLPETEFVAIEAQRNSFQLLQQNIARNQLSGRVRALFGDLRDLAHPEIRSDGFDLITGTPPYVLPGSATPSSDAQRAFARQEFRGGVEAYLQAARRCLSPLGRVVVCADARTPERVHNAAQELGLHVLRQRDVIPRAGEKGALFSVFTLCHQAEARESALGFVREDWVARDGQGARTQAYHDLRAFFGFAPKQDELPSP